MFIRVFRAKVRAGMQAQFKKVIELLTLPNIQYRNGMVAFYPGQPSANNPNEFVLITVWRNADASRMQSKDDWARAIIPPEALPMVQDFDIQSYQAFGVSEPKTPPLFNAI
jgi:quinol monooxygenase YgiN